MIRRMPPALRRLMTTLIALVAGYFACEAPFLYMDFKQLNPQNPPPIRPGRILLFIACVGCGFHRVMGHHPIYSNGYKRWLELTPWTSRQQLPLGPVALTWGDGLFMATVILLSSTQPEPRSMQLVCIFLLSHLLALLPTMWLGSWAIGYTTTAGLGLAVRFFKDPVACLGVATIVYVIAYEGLRRSLERFPWPDRRRTQPSSENVLGDEVVAQSMEVGWPYGQVLAEVRDLRPISRIDAVLGCMLLSWWLDCVSSLSGDPAQRKSFFGFVFMATAAVPIIRLVIYCRGYAAPLSLWARIRTWRWIVPGYDQVFIGPIGSFLAGPLTAVFLTALQVPLEVGLSVTCGMMVLVALLTPPSLRRWRLTGAHRMVPTIAQDNAHYVRVG